MNHAGHFIEICSCGAVIAQCRCFDKNKPTRVVERGCHLCKTKRPNYVVMPEFTLQGAGRSTATEENLVEHIKEAIKLSPTGAVQVREE